MSYTRIAALTILAMIAFGGNSLLCRVALKNTAIDAASFTSIRLISGAVMLWLVVRMRGASQTGKGNWMSASALFDYAAGFSFAYVSLPAATGALLLFGAVQATMICHGIWAGERLFGTALPALKATHAATVQLSVPIIAALGGIVFLGEPMTLRLVLATVAILGGIALVILEKRYANGAR